MTVSSWHLAASGITAVIECEVLIAKCRLQLPNSARPLQLPASLHFSALPRAAHQSLECFLQHVFERLRIGIFHRGGPRTRERFSPRDMSRPGSRPLLGIFSCRPIASEQHLAAVAQQSPRSSGSIMSLRKNLSRPKAAEIAIRPGCRDPGSAQRDTFRFRWLLGLNARREKERNGPDQPDADPSFNVPGKRLILMGDVSCPSAFLWPL